MANKTLKVAVVGLSVGHAGSIGPERPSLIHNFRQIEGVEVVAYCEYNKPELLKDAEVHHPEANTYTDVDELIAKEDFDVALRQEPNDASSWLGRGGALLEMGDRLAAIDDFQRSVECDPSLREAQFALGDTLYEVGRLAEARGPLEAFLKLAPQHPNAPWARATIRRIRSRIRATDPSATGSGK